MLSEQALDKYSKKHLAIINSAIHEFDKNGYENTSLEDITSKLGLTDKSIYYYFDSKEDLFVAAVHQVQEQLCLLIQKTQSLKTSGLAKVRYLSISVVNIVGMALLADLPQQILKNKKFKDKNKHLLKHHDIWVNFFREGQKDGSIIDGDPINQWSFITGSLHYLHKWYRLQGGDPYYHLNSMLEDMIDRMYSTSYKKIK